MSHDDDDSANLRAEMIEKGMVTRAFERDRGPMYDTAELVERFEVIGYAAPFVIARRRSDGVLGSLMFTTAPRIYFGWAPDRSDDEL
jgi:hypothetical protein